MKKFFSYTILCFSLILAVSSFVSAGFFSDFWDGIFTGKVIDADPFVDEFIIIDPIEEIQSRVYLGGYSDGRGELILGMAYEGIIFPEEGLNLWDSLDSFISAEDYSFEAREEWVSSVSYAFSDLNEFKTRMYAFFDSNGYVSDIDIPIIVDPIDPIDPIDPPKPKVEKTLIELLGDWKGYSEENEAFLAEYYRVLAEGHLKKGILAAPSNPELEKQFIAEISRFYGQPTLTTIDFANFVGGSGLSGYDDTFAQGQWVGNLGVEEAAEAERRGISFLARIRQALGFGR